MSIRALCDKFWDLNTPDPAPTPVTTAPEPQKPGSPAAAPPTGKDRPWKLSASTEAFIAQMAENLRTHDPANPKGRLRVRP